MNRERERQTEKREKKRTEGRERDFWRWKDTK
jgi:hypothetical protein